MPGMSVDPNAFRAIMGRFATGVTIVTTCQGTRRAGITVNAFASVSLDPPLVVICIDRSSHVHEVLLESGMFAVNILTQEQAELSSCFAGNSDYRYTSFCGAASHTEATGAPVLDESLGFVDCRIVAVYPGGDLSIIVGRVEALGGSAGEPLLYYRSHYLDPAERTR